MAYEVPPLPYDYAALEPHIDEADDASPPRQAPPGVRGQGQRRARGHRLRRQADRGGPQEPRRAARRQAEGRPQQRRRPLQPLAVLGVAVPGRRRRARRRRWPRRSTARSAPSTTSRRSSRRPASTSSAPAGPGWSTTAPAWRSSARPTRTTRSPPARRRCSAPTSGSTPTTSSTRTSARTTSTRSGTSSTGPRSPSATRRSPESPTREFYEAGYTQPDAAEALRLGRWRALGARSKAAHVARAVRATELRPRDGRRDRLRRRRAAGGAARARAGVRRLRALGAGRRARARRALPTPGRIEAFDGAEVPAEDGEYDLAILSHVLEHVPDPRPLLAEAARVAHEVLVEVPLEDNRSAARPAKREEAARIGHLHAFSRAACGRSWTAPGSSCGPSSPIRCRAPTTRSSPTAPRARAAAAKWAVRAAAHRVAPRRARDAVHRALRGAGAPALGGRAGGRGPRLTNTTAVLIIAICAAVAAAGLVLVARCSARRRRPRCRRAATLASASARALGAGLIAAGAGGRLVMRLLAVTSPDARRRDHRGRGHDRRDHPRRHARLRRLRRAPGRAAGGRALRARRPASSARGRAGGLALGAILLDPGRLRSWSRCAPRTSTSTSSARTGCRCSASPRSRCSRARSSVALAARLSRGVPPLDAAARACCWPAGSRSRSSCSWRCRSSPATSPTSSAAWRGGPPQRPAPTRPFLAADRVERVRPGRCRTRSCGRRRPGTSGPRRCSRR